MNKLIAIFYLIVLTGFHTACDRENPKIIDSDIEQLDLNSKEDIDSNSSAINRDILDVELRTGDSIFVRGELSSKENLKKVLHHFYTANEISDTDKLMPVYSIVTLEMCFERMDSLQTSLLDIKDSLARSQVVAELNLLKIKKSVCVLYESESFREISNKATIKLKCAGGISYGLYIDVLNIIKKEVRELRQIKCDEFGWGNYNKIDDEFYVMNFLEIFVPERIIEFHEKE